MNTNNMPMHRQDNPTHHMSTEGFVATALALGRLTDPRVTDRAPAEGTARPVARTRGAGDLWRQRPGSRPYRSEWATTLTGLVGALPLEWNNVLAVRRARYMTGDKYRLDRRRAPRRPDHAGNPTGFVRAGDRGVSQRPAPRRGTGASSHLTTAPEAMMSC